MTIGTLPALLLGTLTCGCAIVFWVGTGEADTGSAVAGGAVVAEGSAVGTFITLARVSLVEEGSAVGTVTTLARVSLVADGSAVGTVTMLARTSIVADGSAVGSVSAPVFESVIGDGNSSTTGVGVLSASLDWLLLDLPRS